MKPSVDLFFDIQQSFYFSATLYAGLNVLKRRGVIKARFRGPQPAERDLTQIPDVVCLEVRPDSGSRPRLLAFDLRDPSHNFAAGVLERCDAYLKRSFHRPDLAGLPGELVHKVHPFGLHYACRTFRSTVGLFRRSAFGLLLCGRSGLEKLYRHLSLPRIADFEQAPTTPLDPTISFQTRVWEAEDTAPGEHEAINQERVALIRALKETFGDRFRGGLVPTPLALARYPREVSALPSKRKLYTAMNKRSLIGIYTRGLHHSSAFKLPESLAASQCLVAEPPRNELPVPLLPEKHFLPFQTVDECVAACQRLLADRELARRMREANHAYYQSEVEPAAHLLRILERHAGFPCTA